MAGQDRTNPTRREHDAPEPAEPAVPAAAAQADTAAVDDLLDEIDDVLETNAESFVRNFVQKGGQ
ncbi:ubiquitin-like protein Pup [Saxibacter everestensis]|uniref:Prokaryotic ubiquitin-like protein Pup n=1 Tax=Saxibacter everestensis TaxID=2909229 RepID=A0ABY8QXC5_9MICO|nr:ubiquitin-like protein Pup [Brevibacteriaceae bacterium ZFBP1038]